MSRCTGCGDVKGRADHNCGRELVSRDELRNLSDGRDRWVRLFNRLDGAISHHRKAKSDLFIDEVDESLYHAHDQILKEAAGA